MGVNRGVGHRCGLDQALLWLWCRSVATAPIQHLPWESRHDIGAAPKEDQKEKKKKKKCYK